MFQHRHRLTFLLRCLVNVAQRSSACATLATNHQHFGAAILGTYQRLPQSATCILPDFSKVEYLNYSGTADRHGQTIQTFGLTPYFQRFFTMVGITRYTTLKTACAAFTA